MEYKYLDFEFDQGRLNRSHEVAVVTIDSGGEQLPDNHYMAFGGSPQLHYCHTQPHIGCDCPDFEWGGETRLCKHLIAALRHEGDEVLKHIVDHANNNTLGVRGKQEQ